MKETKKDPALVRSFRVSDEVNTRFKEFAETIGATTDIALKTLIDSYEMESAKHAIPNRETEITSFQANASALIGAYLNSLQLNENAESRIYANFVTSIERKDAMISELQDKLKANEELAIASQNMAFEAEKNMKDAQEKALAATEVAKAKEELVALLHVQLDEINAELAEHLVYGNQLAELSEVNKAQAKEISKLEEFIREMEFKLSKESEMVMKDAEIDKLNALKELDDKWINHCTAIELALQEKEKDLIQLAADKDNAINQIKLEYQSENSNLKIKIANLENQILQLQPNTM